MFPLLYGATDGVYTQNNPGPYNTIVDNNYYLSIPSGVTLQNGEYNVYQEYMYNFGRANVTVNVNGIQAGTNVYIFRKAFYQGYGWIQEYYVTQQLVNGINNFTITSKYGINGVAIEQLGIMVTSPPTGTCRCNVLGVNISFT